jgi:hypothetical protein
MVSKVSIRVWKNKKAVKKLKFQNQKRKIKKTGKTKKTPQYSNKRFKKIKEEIEKEKKMKAFQIVKRLERVKSFLGVYSSDNLPVINSSPCFLVVNIDGENLPGSHWIALRISEKQIEVYDSLKLKTYPEPLLSLFKSKSLKRLPQIQSNDSFLCGLYACFFILSRNIYSFQKVCTFFTDNLSDNDLILCQLLNEFW